MISTVFQRDIEWMQIAEIGNRWKLLSFNKKQPRTWENYLEYEKKYWSFDDPNQQRMKLYFGKENTKENFIIKTKLGYQKSVEQSNYWQSLCRINEFIYIKLVEPNVIALLREDANNPKYYYEVWAKRKYLFGLFPKEYCCELYSIGYVERDPLYPRDHGTVSHRVGIEKDKNEKLLYFPETNQIQISDALFEIYR